MAKRLVRPSSGKMIAGVCAGIARYFNIDPTIVRLIWVILLFGYGSGVLAYFLAWIIIPQEESF